MGIVSAIELQHFPMQSSVCLGSLIIVTKLLKNNPMCFHAAQGDKASIDDKHPSSWFTAGKEVKQSYL
jgi:hypothetical protein